MITNATQVQQLQDGTFLCNKYGCVLSVCDLNRELYRIHTYSTFGVSWYELRNGDILFSYDNTKRVYNRVTKKFKILVDLNANTFLQKDFYQLSDGRIVLIDRHSWLVMSENYKTIDMYKGYIRGVAEIKPSTLLVHANMGFYTINLDTKQKEEYKSDLPLSLDYFIKLRNNMHVFGAENRLFVINQGEVVHEEQTLEIELLQEISPNVVGYAVCGSVHTYDIATGVSRKYPVNDKVCCFVLE